MPGYREAHERSAAATEPQPNDHRASVTCLGVEQQDVPGRAEPSQGALLALLRHVSCGGLLRRRGQPLPGDWHPRVSIMLESARLGLGRS